MGYNYFSLLNQSEVVTSCQLQVRVAAMPGSRPAHLRPAGSDGTVQLILCGMSTCAGAVLPCAHPPEECHAALPV